MSQEGHEMTNSTYEFVGKVSRLVSFGFSSMEVSVFAVSGRFFGFLVRNTRTGELALPTQTGKEFSINAENTPPLPAAFPARLSGPDGRWVNLYPEATTDLDAVPVSHMLEAAPNGNTSFNGFRAPGRTIQQFVAEPSGGVSFGCKPLDRIEIAYRPPTSVTAGLPVGARPKGGGSGLQPVHYGPAHSFGAIRLVNRTVLAPLLAKDGYGDLDPANDEHWAAHTARDRGSTLRYIQLESGVNVE